MSDPEVLARLADLATRARDAKAALHQAVRGARRSGISEAAVVRATGLARATVRAWARGK